MLKEIPNAGTIIDLTVHIGIDSVNITILYPDAKITSIEINPQVYLMLRDNFLSYTILLKKSPFMLRAYNSDVSTILNHPFIKNTDFVYVDPEWDGPEYINQHSIKIKVSNLDVSEVVRILLNNDVKTLVLKAPNNYI